MLTCCFIVVVVVVVSCKLEKMIPKKEGGSTHERDDRLREDRRGGRDRHRPSRFRSRSRSRDRHGGRRSPRERDEGRRGRGRSRSRSRSRERERHGGGRGGRWDREKPSQPVVSQIYNGKVTSIMQFGCFVQLEGGCGGLHIARRWV